MTAPKADDHYSAVYARLNPAQRKAVDTIYGPVLVIAGPGTGKTQLLSARVAHILQATDSSPENILCLTFTESGAANMRERLSSFIGQASYNVRIGTYHSFGSSIISRFPEYFTDIRLERPIDDLGKREILAEIIAQTSYTSPIKQLQHHLGDLLSTLSEVKRGLLSPDDLRAIAAANQADITSTQSEIADLLAPYAARMPAKSSVGIPLFESVSAILEQRLAQHTPKIWRHKNNELQPLVKIAAGDLRDSLAAAEELDSTKPLTAWKNRWLAKNADNQFTLAGELEAHRIAALAGVLEKYQERLADRGLYDFDDMILRTISALENHDALRFSLQEAYQFILLDEFQDTNAAQLRLVRLLTDNPVHEGRPNVLAVGDDDQAIYAFQGAEASNMLDFARMYRDVTVISLTENYRSRNEILQTASNVAEQIEHRLHQHFPNTSKHLTAQNQTLPAANISRQIYRSAIAENHAVASQIAQLIEQGTNPKDIAVLAPKHRYLEPLVPYLRSLDIMVAYEKRENILEAPIIHQLLTMSRLILALRHRQLSLADSIWPEVLSYDFWGFSTADIWSLSWEANDTHQPWSKILLNHPTFKHAAMLLLSLANRVDTEGLELILDALIGNSDVQTHDNVLPSVRSPLLDYYLKLADPATLYETINQLTVIRAKLRDYQAGVDRLLVLEDLLEFVSVYEAAEQPILNTSPYNQAADAVQLMTVFKAKGLEYDHVFLLACDNSVWGNRSGGAGNKFTLPANLASIRHAGSTDDERLRLLYVAITRARYGLYLSSHSNTFNGRTTESVKYFNELINEDGQVVTGILPANFSIAQQHEDEPPSQESLLLNWRQRHIDSTASLKDLLRERLTKLQISPTHLTHFLNLTYGGPESFFLHTILRFPSAPNIDTTFGNAIHDSLRWAQAELNKTGTLPSVKQIIDYAIQDLQRQPISEEQRSVQIARATHALDAFLHSPAANFKPGNRPEFSFRNEGVFLGEVHLGGAVDLIEIDQRSKHITVVDYKSGKLGTNPVKLHLYTLQLYCYKLLIEGSSIFRGYKVEKGRLVFVEPNSVGDIIEKVVEFNDKDEARTRQLLERVHQHVISLDMPDMTGYGDGIKGLLAFEDSLIGNT